MPMYIKANQSAPVQKTFKPETSLEELQKYVGGYVEGIRLGSCPETGKARTMWVNEDGIPLGLPINGLASIIAGYRVVGDVVISYEGEELVG